MKKSLSKDFSFLLILLIAVVFFTLKGTVVGILDGDFGSGGECLFFGVKNALNNGEIPLWFPWVWGGLTGAGTTVTQSMYPVNWVIFSILGNHSLKWFMILNYAAHFYLFILGLFIFCRVNNFNTLNSFCATLIVGTALCITWQFHWYYIFFGFAYFPLIISMIMLFEKNDRFSWIYLIIASLMLGLSGLANQGQSLLINILFSVFFYLYFIVKNWNFKYFITLTTKMVVFGSLGLFICSPALLPAIEFFKNCARYVPEHNGFLTPDQKISLEAFTKYSISFQDLGSLLQFPSPVNNPILTNFRPVPVLLSFFLVLGLLKRNNDNMKRFITLIMVFCLLYVTGFILPNIFYYIPYYNGIREPFLYQPYLCLPFVFFVAAGIEENYNQTSLIKNDYISLLKFYIKEIILLVLIGIGIILQKDKLNIIIFSSCLVFIILKNLLTQHNRILSIIKFFVLIFIVSIQFHQNYMVQKKYSFVYSKNESKERKQNVIDTLKELEKFEHSENDKSRHFSFGVNAYPSNSLTLVNKYDYFGYFNPTGLNNYLTYSSIAWSKRGDLFNIKYWYTSTDETSSHYSLLRDKMKADNLGHFDTIPSFDNQEKQKIQVWRYNTNGSAWLVNKAIKVDDFSFSKKELLTAAYSDINNTDIRNTAFVNEELSLDGQECFESKIETLEIKNNSSKYRVTSNQNSLMVSSNFYYPGWKVYVDGTRKKLLQCDYFLQGVSLQTGEHIVEFKYLPLTFIIGCILFVLAVFIMFGICLFVLKRQKKL